MFRTLVAHIGFSLLDHDWIMGWITACGSRLDQTGSKAHYLEQRLDHSWITEHWIMIQF
jgi:hypothetical protein